MKRIKYVLSHSLPALALFIVLIIAVTSGIDYVHSQLNSAKDGIEILLVDTALSIGDNNELAKAVKTATGVKYVGVATLELSEAEQYVKTIKNYTLTDYLVYSTGSRDAELIIFPEEMLETVKEMSNLAPDTEIYDVTNACFTEYGAQLLSIGKIYGAITNGDHASEIQAYLNGLSFKEE